MSEHKNSEPLTQGAGPKRHTGLIISVAIIVLVIVVVGVFLVIDKSTKKDSNSDSTVQSVLNDDPTLTDTEAQAKAKDAVSSSKGKSKQEQAAAYAALGRSEYNLDDYHQAVLDFQKALTLDGSSDTSSTKVYILSGLGYAYAQDNQTSKAIDTFTQLVSILRQQKADSITINNYQSEINYLKSQGSTE